MKIEQLYSFWGNRVWLGGTESLRLGRQMLEWTVCFCSVLSDKGTVVLGGSLSGFQRRRAIGAARAARTSLRRRRQSRSEFTCNSRSGFQVLALMGETSKVSGFPDPVRWVLREYSNAGDCREGGHSTDNSPLSGGNSLVRPGRKRYFHDRLKRSLRIHRGDWWHIVCFRQREIPRFCSLRSYERGGTLKP